MKKRNKYIYVEYLWDFEDKLGSTSSVFKAKGKQIFKTVYKNQIKTIAL